MIAFIDNNGITVCRAANPFDLKAEKILADWFAGAQRSYLRCGRFTCIVPADNSGCVVGLEFPAGLEFGEKATMPIDPDLRAAYCAAAHLRLDRVARCIAPSHPLFADVMTDLRAERASLTDGTDRRVA